MKYYTTGTQLPPYLPYPKFLLDFPLSETARLVYTLLLSRIQLSRQNGWVDADGRVWCRYTIRDLMQDTGKGKTTILTALADLEASELLSRRRSGIGYANELYLRLPENCTAQVQKTAPGRYGKPAPNKYKNKKNINLNYEYTGDSL